MKRLLTILTLIYPILLFGQSDKIVFNIDIKSESNLRLDSSYTNYYVLEKSDTMFFTRNSNVIQCNYLQLTDRSHNKCRIFVNKKPAQGNIRIHFSGDNGKTKHIYSGTLDSGYYETGTYLIYSGINTHLAVGQYLNNWKFGFWTTYFPNGKIETVNQYIIGADDPVRVWEYDQNGQLINFAEEEDEIIKRIIEEKNVR